QVCWPSEAAQVYFLQVFSRPPNIPGAQTASICAPRTETTCNQYSFQDIAFGVNPSPEFGTGGYDMHYVNTVINCQSFADPLPVCSTLQSDVGTPNAYNCLATVYDPANFKTVCPTCLCINGCRTACNGQGLPQPSC
ncbi:hypothetical protein Vafri_18135, partial [Volvox africanus]